MKSNPANIPKFYCIEGTSIPIEDTSIPSDHNIPSSAQQEKINKISNIKSHIKHIQEERKKLKVLHNELDENYRFIEKHMSRDSQIKFYTAFANKLNDILKKEQEEYQKKFKEYDELTKDNGITI
jgi:hypothetical protein